MTQDEIAIRLILKTSGINGILELMERRTNEAYNAGVEAGKQLQKQVDNISKKW